MFGKAARTLAAVLVWCLVALGAAGQQVKVYDQDPPANGSTQQDWVTQSDQDQKILVIPVVTMDTAWDPVNNQLDPALRTLIVTRMNAVNNFWVENSYGRVSFVTTVLDRVYQMPRGKSFYFNPDYIEPVLVGTQIRGPMVTVPAGNLRLVLHITAADETTINIPFTAAESPFTLNGLRDKVCNNLGAGDKLQCTLVDDGGNLRHFRLAAGQSYVTEGTFIHVDFGGSSQAVLDALGLDRPVEDLTAPGVGLDTRGAQFPLAITAGSALTLTLTNTAGATQNLVWNFPAAQTFNTAGDFVTAHGGATGNAAISAAGGEYHFEVTPTIAGPLRSLEAAGPADLLDALGLAKSREADGVITFPDRNTVRGHRNLLAGQAVAAYLLNELTRPHTGPGADPIPNRAITAANEAAIDAIVASMIDPHRVVVVLFLDEPPNQREGAAGGYINFGIENGGYTYEYQMVGGVQIDYDGTSHTVIAHELGHNLGFYDLYNNSNDYLPSFLYANNWDVMDAAGDLPHTSMWHKEIIARWLSDTGAAVASFPEPPAMGVETRRYVVTPIEFSDAEYDNNLAGVPADRTLVKTIRLPLGLGPVSEHHYLLVENRQTGALFSQNLPQKVGAPARGGIYITDAITPASWIGNLMNPSSRNVLHPLSDAPLASGDASPVLDASPSNDINFLGTFPAYDGLTVDVVGSLPGPGTLSNRPSFLVNVSREQKNFLDLAIKPWGAPPWESDDIWIEHADGSLSPTPLLGNGEPARWSATYNPAANGGNPLNWIRVNVRNQGNVDATNVRVRVKINTPGGMGDTGTWVTQPTSDPQNIPAGQSRIFNIPWTPRVNSHTCIEAEVISWESLLGDRDPWNQRTQENVNSFHPTSSSPWTPVPIEFDVASNRTHDVDVYLMPQDLPPGYIVDLDQDFIRIPAKGKVRITGTLRLDDAVIPTPSSSSSSPSFTHDRRRPVKPGMFHITGFIVGDEWQLPLGGVTYLVFPARLVHGNVSVGTDGGNVVVTGTTSPASPGDEVEILICYQSGKCEWVETTTDGGGNISVSVPPKEEGPVNVTVYLPPNYAPKAPVDATVDPDNPLAPPGGGGIAVPGRREVGFFWGGFFPATKLGMESGFNTGFRAGAFFHPKWSAEGEAGIVFTEAAGVEGLLGHLHGNVLWHPGNATWKTRPFLLAGLGGARFQSGAVSDSTLAVVLGIGANFHWHPRVGFRFDIRNFWMRDLFGAGRTNNLQGNWGVVFRY